MKTKICFKCKKELNARLFRKRVKNKGLQPYCIACQREYDKAYWIKTRDKRKLHRHVNDRKIRIRNAQTVFDYLKNHPCVDCGEKDPVVLEFDHFKPKIESISNMVRKRSSLGKIFNEINKCVVRCANCHRRKTAKELNWYANIRK